MALSIMFLLVLALMSYQVNGYPKGAPSDQCTDMTPAPSAPPNGHNATTQPEPSPFNVSISVPDAGASPGESYDMTISGDGRTHRGFLCEVRKVSTTDIVGEFTSFDTTLVKNVNCSGNAEAAITHTSRVEKNSTVATWQAPASVSQDYQLVVLCTVVEVRIRFWVQVPSATFVLKAPTAPPTTAANATDMAASTTDMATPSGSTTTVASFGILCLALFSNRVMSFVW
jgi:hypothetical protein